MPAFAAINVEPEENVDEEIDTTRELHIDDALKLFQTALKLHAQGPRFFNEASNAYDALFNSEIFKYPEAATDYERAQRQPEPHLVTESPFTQGVEVSVPDADGTGSSLPQALYLSYKNHGQFILDRIKHQARTAKLRSARVFEDHEVVRDAHKSLCDLNAALDRDPSDAELWRRTARVAAFLKSSRTSRYCLESAVELDDDPAVVDVEPPSLAESFAGQQLKDHLSVLSDEVALSHPIMKSFVRNSMPAGLERFIDPFPFLPDPTKSLAVPKQHTDEPLLRRLVIDVPNASWSDLGMSLVQFFGEHWFSGDAITLQLDSLDEDQAAQMEVDRQLQAMGNGGEIVDGAKTLPPLEKTAEKAVEIMGSAAATTSGVAESSQNERSISLPSRKRSQSAAGLPDPAEDENVDTKRSKRIRRRDTAAEEAMDPATLLATQLQPFQGADQNLFQTTKNILENLGAMDRATLERIAEILDSCASEDRVGKINHPATRDLRQAIVAFDTDTAQIMLNKKESPTIGLSAFLEHTKSSSQWTSDTPAFDESSGLRNFVSKVNSAWMTIHDVSFEWVIAISRSYTRSKWSDNMKTAVVQVISRLDRAIYDRAVSELELFWAGKLEHDVRTAVPELYDLVQMLFELHLDVYERITNPNSVVEYAIRVETKGRVGRWLDVATEIARLSLEVAPDRELRARFLWAAVFSITLSEGVTRDHILACWKSLRDFLASTGCPTVNLPNNAVMPEVSPGAADTEISKLTTMDFFLSLFQEDIADPVSLIHTLEPVLNPDSVLVADGPSLEVDNVGMDVTKSESSKKPISECASPVLRDLWKFLSNSSTELRLVLWSRLSDAYLKIKYSTKQFSCYLRSIEMIVLDFDRDSYTNASPDSRRVLLATMLKSLDDLLVQALSMALNDNSAFDIVDEEHLKATSSALAKLSCMLHIAAMYDDELRVGISHSQPPGASFQSFLNKLREMQVRTWSLQYTVLKVGVNQINSSFLAPENDLADYLAAVHQVLGLRKCCKSSNKIFLKMMRVELLKQKNIENWEDYLGQVLFDLHGLKLGVGIWEVQDHGCPPEKLEKRNAMQLVEKITVLANRMPMKDLLKSDLKTTIEHMQQAIGQTKSTAQMIHNLRNFTEFLKKPIHPLRLYQALSGSVTLDAVTVNTADSAPAKHGWFFLLGLIAFTKFKGVDLNRRQTPGATDDLRIGATFLRLQLQFTPDRWDAWFRLAECFDYELDEAVLWTADKINRDRAELVKFQRNSIHCYTLALSSSQSWTESPEGSTPAEDSDEALSELYHNFGMRLYASSREPFAMEPFQHSDQERFFIENMGAGTYKKILHEEITDYKVWKYAANLFRRAMVGRPRDWKNPYMLAKCLWKMYQKPLEKLDENDRRTRPTVQAVIKSLEKTIEVVSLLPKPRHGQDPVLEPHYKILSVVHKLVMRRALPWQEGADILQRQPYAIQQRENITINDVDDWDAFVIKSLRHLRDKDKSNWQHRLIIRHARILFDEGGNEDSDQQSAGDSDRYVSAKAAFTVLRESMFTKTMVMNVWKCDAERPGRHHVYTEQYVRLMVRLLGVMNDRTNMEALLRRIRKKGADFYHFTDLWQTCLVAYVGVLRKSYDILPTGDDAFKAHGVDEFEILTDRISNWVSGPESQDNRFVMAMRDAIEIKKVNAMLVKAAPIDDLISDCYAVLYQDIAPTLPGAEPAKIIEERNRARDDALRLDGASDPKLMNGANGVLQLPGRDKEVTALGSLRASPEGAEKMERQLSSTGEPAHRARRPIVRRHDILRKAEQAITRAAEGPPKSASAGGPSSKSRLGSTSSGKKATSSGDADDAGSDADNDPGQQAGDGDMRMGDGDDGERRGANDGVSRGSSPAASVHDSADESDLSDVPPDYDEDAPPPTLIFPNLVRRSTERRVGEVANGSQSDEESSIGGETEGEEGSSPVAEANEEA